MQRKELAVKIENAVQRLSETEMLKKVSELIQGENKVLMYICCCDDEEIIYPSDISLATDITRQRVTAILVSLEKKEFVELINSKEDRRRVQVKLTKKGYHYIKAKRDDVVRYYNFFIDSIGVDALDQITDIINNAIDKLCEAEKNGGLK